MATSDTVTGSSTDPRTFVPVDELLVDDPALATALSGRGPRYLAPFFRSPATVSEAAEYLGESMARTHYWVKRWLALGALVEVAREPRAGRAMARYRVRAMRFVVRDSLLPETLLEQQLSRVNQQMLEALAWGGVGGAAPSMRIWQPEGHHGVTVERDAPGPRGPGRGSVHSSFVLVLDDDEAAELRSELNDLRDRWFVRAGGQDRRPGDGRHRHLTILASAQLPPE